MSFNFTPDESDNSLYWNKLNTMDNQELEQEYRELMRSRGEGGDMEYNLQMCFDIIQTFYERRGLALPKVPEDHTIFSYIMQVDTPESSSIACYGYDFFQEILYFKYMNNPKVYSFPKVSLDMYNCFKNSKSKGKEVARLRKELAGK
jgi:hypothetical protein